MGFFDGADQGENAKTWCTVKAARPRAAPSADLRSIIIIIFICALCTKVKIDKNGRARKVYVKLRLPMKKDGIVDKKADTDSMQERVSRITAKLESMAVPMVEYEFSPEMYHKLFPNGKIDTPIGEVKMGENQYKKLETRDQGKRKRYLGAMYQTLKEPIVIIKQYKEKDKGKPSWLYTKSFISGNNRELVVSVVVNQYDDNNKKPIRVSVSTHPMEKEPVLNQIKKPYAIAYERP